MTAVEASAVVATEVEGLAEGWLEVVVRAVGG